MSRGGRTMCLGDGGQCVSVRENNVSRRERTICLGDGGQCI